MSRVRHIGEIINEMFRPKRSRKYADYLNSIDWKAKCTRLIQKRGKRCEVCNSSYRIEVHHLTYKRIFNERLEDLKVLCFQCHRKAHPEKEQYSITDEIKGWTKRFNEEHKIT